MHIVVSSGSVGQTGGLHQQQKELSLPFDSGLIQWDWATPQLPNYVSALMFFSAKRRQINMGKPTPGWLKKLTPKINK